MEDDCMTEPRLTDDENSLLVWLGQEDYGQYGECHGASLDSLIEKDLAQLHQGREFQSSFIAKGDSKMHQAVSLTEKGREARREHLKSDAASKLGA
jgi:hypothetical protein